MAAFYLRQGVVQRAVPADMEMAAALRAQGIEWQEPFPVPGTTALVAKLTTT